MKRNNREIGGPLERPKQSILGGERWIGPKRKRASICHVFAVNGEQQRGDG